MTMDLMKSVEIFFCYASEDKALLDDLKAHLNIFKHIEWISSWYDRELRPEIDWEAEVDVHIESADIILPLVSPDFMSSDYLWGVEMRRALERHNAGNALTIPIIIRSAHWQGSPIGKLQALPANGQPVMTNWGNPVEALWQITQDIRNVVRSLLARKTEELSRHKDEARIMAENLDAKLLNQILQEKIAMGIFDVFLCYNSKDRHSVKKLGESLKMHGVSPWLDEWELRPGFPWQRLLENQIEKIKSAAVFVGKDGTGPWQRQEIDAFLREFVNRGCPVIPVLLEEALQEPKLPLFLRGMTWVDFREQDPEPLRRLIWGITGERSLP